MTTLVGLRWCSRYRVGICVDGDARQVVQYSAGLTLTRSVTKAARKTWADELDQFLVELVGPAARLKIDQSTSYDAARTLSTQLGEIMKLEIRDAATATETVIDAKELLSDRLDREETTVELRPPPASLLAKLKQQQDGMVYR